MEESPEWVTIELTVRKTTANDLRRRLDAMQAYYEGLSRKECEQAICYNAISAFDLYHIYDRLHRKSGGVREAEDE